MEKSKIRKQERNLSLIMIVGIYVFIFLSDKKILTADLTRPINIISLLILLMALIYWLYKLRDFRKKGLNIAEQEYRNPIVDMVNPEVGDSVARYNKWRMHLFWGLIILMIVFAIIKILIRVGL